MSEEGIDIDKLIEDGEKQSRQLKEAANKQAD